jgi:hypothetical protein
MMEQKIKYKHLIEHFYFVKKIIKPAKPNLLAVFYKQITKKLCLEKLKSSKKLFIC